MWRLLLGAAVALAFCATAPGFADAMSVVGESGQPITAANRLVARSRVPVVNLRVAVSTDLSPCGGFSACLQYAPPVIHMADLSDEFGFMHEVGHLFGYYVLGDVGRAAATTDLGLAGPWRSEPYARSPNEQFADAYAWCALSDNLQLRALLTADLGPAEFTYRQVRRTCGLVRRVGRRAGLGTGTRPRPRRY